MRLQLRQDVPGKLHQQLWHILPTASPSSPPLHSASINGKWDVPRGAVHEHKPPASPPPSSNTFPQTPPYTPSPTLTMFILNTPKLDRAAEGRGAAGSAPAPLPAIPSAAADRCAKAAASACVWVRPRPWEGRWGWGWWGWGGWIGLGWVGLDPS